MNEEQILASLEELIAQLSVDLRYEKGDFVGGFYRYNEKEQFVINKSLNIKQKINVLAKELKQKLDVNDLYIVPALREVIENASSME
ncbi:MAG: hypothetical protein ACE5HS_14705 [bacterium]